jgi:hypothetical protein
MEISYSPDDNDIYMELLTALKAKKIIYWDEVNSIKNKFMISGKRLRRILDRLEGDGVAVVKPNKYIIYNA